MAPDSETESEAGEETEMEDGTETGNPTTDAAPTPPEPVREFVSRVLSEDEVRETFEDTVVDVPSRFDRPSPTARWRFDGTLTVRVADAGE
ncbi:hypothetical protein ACFO0N_18785 [Halobium salinum]|uniref:Halobacterial output domain-containing protein n=1 Tax=Halobium salinum TaxID=1364940 RepID=A0ABD5PH06_9EURY|nr:hypothetical protein [Halobium salinum]